MGYYDTYDSKQLINIIIENPNILLEDINFSSALENEMISNNFIPDKKYFRMQPKLRNFTKLLDYALENDPSMLVFYPREYLDITNNEILRKAREAVANGFVATEDDLIYNSGLCYINHVMYAAIKNDPKLLRYLRGNCFIMSDVAKEFCDNYKITREDLINNPELAENNSIMRYFPEYDLYRNPNIEIKIDILSKMLEQKIELNQNDLPFLDKRFGAKADINKLKELLSILDIDFDENDLLTQKKYYFILDRVVDGIVNINYINKKRMFEFEYTNIVALNDMILREFNLISGINKEEVIEKITSNIQKFVGGIYPYESIKKEIEKFYDIYSKNHVIGVYNTSDFCNKILNLHKDWFIKTNKKVIFNNVRSRLYLTDKKKKTLIIGYKVKKIADAIKNNELENLNINKEEYASALETAQNSILNNKEVKRSVFDIDEDFIKEVIKEFSKEGRIKDDTSIREIRRISEIYMLNGSIENSIYEPVDVFVNKFINYISSNSIGKKEFYDLLDNYCEISRYIIKKINSVRNVFIKSFDLTSIEEREVERKNKPEGVNYNDYVIASRKRYYKILAEILLSLDDENLSSILENKDSLFEITDLIPFIGLVDGFDKSKIINIMKTYEQSKEKTIRNGNKRDDETELEYIYRRLEMLILYSTAYNSVSDITIAALGNDLMSILDATKANGYIEIYKQMLNRKNGYIPPVRLHYGDIYLESGKYGDPDRFLISKRPLERSCIDLEDSGEEIYKEMLTSYTGDVALIRDGESKVISRVFLLRRGNVVQMATSCSEHYPMEMFKQIADQIMDTAIKNNDNIEYIFVNSSSCEGQDCSNYIPVEKNEFSTAFPHADLYNMAYLLSTKDKEHDYTKGGIELDFGATPKVLYKGIRRSIKNNPIESEITRIIALYIEMIEDAEEKERKARNFKQVHYDEYDRVICGEDWYVAQRKNGVIEQLILQSANEEAIKEFEEAKMSFQTGSYKR